MLNSIEHEILNAHKYKNIKKFGFFLGSDKPRMLFFLLINVVGILTFMSKKNFMLNSVEHEKSFITSGPRLNTLRTLDSSSITSTQYSILSCLFYPITPFLIMALFKLKRSVSKI